LRILISTSHSFVAGEFSREAIARRKNVMNHCLDGKADRELQSLYALQHLMHKLEHPNSKLLVEFYFAF
jgi:hypothetical protein